MLLSLKEIECNKDFQSKTTILNVNLLSRKNMIKLPIYTLAMKSKKRSKLKI